MILNRRPFSFVAATFLTLCTAASQGSNEPIVRKRIADFTVSAATRQSVINLKGTFALKGVTGSVVRFSSTQGDIDVELTPDVAPKTVENFLNYVERGDYDGTFIHRSVPGFVVQGGGFSFVDDNVETVPQDPSVINEFNVSNTRGTIAMAKLGGDPDSATNQWFFNESDTNAANLDDQNGGFTVFGRIIGVNGLKVLDTIAQLPTGDFGSPFDSLPVVDYKDPDPIKNENLVSLNFVKVLPLVSSTQTGRALLDLKVFRNTDESVLKATISGSRLILKYSGKAGKATVGIIAKYGGGGQTTTSFTVTHK